MGGSQQVGSCFFTYRCHLMRNKLIWWCRVSGDVRNWDLFSKKTGIQWETQLSILLFLHASVNLSCIFFFLNVGKVCRRQVWYSQMWSKSAKVVRCREDVGQSRISCSVVSRFKFKTLETERLFVFSTCLKEIWNTSLYVTDYCFDSPRLWKCRCFPRPTCTILVSFLTQI